MSLHTLEPTPDLSIHPYSSAALWGALRQNLLGLDQATRVGRSLFCGGYGHPQELRQLNPYRESWGAFRALPGLTTLTTVWRSSGVTAGDTLRIYLNGALSSSHALANGDQVFTTSLGSYAVNSAVEVQWDVFNAGKPAEPASWGTFEPIDAYVGPVGLSDAYPGEPAFTSAYDPAAVNQLARCVDWLIRRVGRRTDPLFQSLVRWNGPYGPAWDEPLGQTTVRWFGGTEKTPATPTLRAFGTVFVSVLATEQVRLLVNDAVVATFNVPNSIGRHNFSLSYALPQATGTRVRVTLDYRRSSNPALISGAEPINRWSVLRVWVEGDQALYPAISVPGVAARSNLTWATWRAALTAAAAACATLKARIDANGDLWSRQRLFRRRYAYDAAQNRWYEPGQVAVALARVGEALLVRGQNNTIGWGAAAWDEQKPNEVGLYPLTNQYSQGATAGDQLTTELIYHSDLKGLYPGGAYNVRGETLAYAGEIWRVGTDVS